MNRGTEEQHPRTGLVMGVAAYGLWGILPIYFKLLTGIGSVSIVAQRVAWSVPFLLVVLLAGGNLSQLRRALGEPRTRAWLSLTALLIGINWLLYVYAVMNGHILAGSLGYYLNPLANVLLGRIVLKERLAPMQWAAVAIAFAGISVLALQALGQLWISLALCVSFASYGLLRKLAPVDSAAGLTVETLFLLPLSLAWLAWRGLSGDPLFGPGNHLVWLVALSGAATAVPLLLFTAAARRLRYSTLGMLQFLAPTLQFVCAVFLYGEPFTRAHAIAFTAIWLALALYVVTMLRSPGLPQAPE